MQRIPNVLTIIVQQMVPISSKKEEAAARTNDQVTTATHFLAQEVKWHITSSLENDNITIFKIYLLIVCMYVCLSVIETMMPHRYFNMDRNTIRRIKTEILL